MGLVSLLAIAFFTQIEAFLSNRERKNLIFMNACHYLSEVSWKLAIFSTSHRNLHLPVNAVLPLSSFFLQQLNFFGKEQKLSPKRQNL